MHDPHLSTTFLDKPGINNQGSFLYLLRAAAVCSQESDHHSSEPHNAPIIGARDGYYATFELIHHKNQLNQNSVELKVDLDSLEIQYNHTTVSRLVEITSRIIGSQLEVTVTTPS